MPLKWYCWTWKNGQYSGVSLWGIQCFRELHDEIPEGHKNIKLAYLNNFLVIDVVCNRPLSFAFCGKHEELLRRIPKSRSWGINQFSSWNRPSIKFNFKGWDGVISNTQKWNWDNAIVLSATPRALELSPLNKFQKSLLSFYFIKNFRSEVFCNKVFNRIL